MTPDDPPDRPPSLDLTDLGPDRWRGQIRVAMSRVHQARLKRSLAAAAVLMIIGLLLPPSLPMNLAYGGSFLALVVVAYSVIGMVTLPLEIDLDPETFTFGDEHLRLAEIESVQATAEPLTLVVVRASGARHAWEINEDRHNLDDIAWLADAIRERLPR